MAKILVRLVKAVTWRVIEIVDMPFCQGWFNNRTYCIMHWPIIGRPLALAFWWAALDE